VLSDCRDREGRFRLTLAELDARLEIITREKTEAVKKHNDEVWLELSCIEMINVDTIDDGDI